MPKKKDPFIEYDESFNPIYPDIIEDDEDEIIWTEIVQVSVNKKDEDTGLGINIDFDAIMTPPIPDPVKPVRNTIPNADEYGEEVPKKRSRKGKDVNTSTGDDEKISRESVDFYEGRFKDSLDVIDTMIHEIDEFKTETKDDLDIIKKSKQRGVLTHVANQTSNITQLLGMKLNALKEKNSVIKTISDLEIKRTSKEGAGNNDNKIIDSIFSKLMNTNSAYEQQAIDYMASSINTSYDSQIDTMLANRTQSLINDGQMEITSSDIATMYESVGAQIVILRDPMTDDWRFMAVDGNYHEIPGYPLPQGDIQIKFLQGGKAKDQYNRMYEVMDIPR